MRRNRVLFVALLAVVLMVTGLMSTTSGRASTWRAPARQDRGPAVIVLHVEYREGEWFLGTAGLQLLPCQPAARSLLGGEFNPLLRILDADGEVVYQDNMPLDPRIILPEDDTGRPTILEEVSFYLRLPLAAGMERFEFFDDPSKMREEGEKPSLSVDLREAIQRFEDRGGPFEAAPCQEPEYRPDQRRKPQS